MDPTSSTTPEPAESPPPAEEPRVRITPRFRDRELERKPEPARKSEAEHEQERRGSSRETVESVVIAFVLAFLFRTFEAEAFVIPTGSMAPTLMGRHKESTCAQCGWVFTVGASEGDRGERPTQGVCPNCRFVNHLDVRFVCNERIGERNRRCGTVFTNGSVCPKCSSSSALVDLRAFKGDRILVLKALYDLPEFVPESLREPKRWDVVVFKYPEEPQINYIKRLVGLPDEEICIQYGNIFTRTPDEADFHIARKPARKQRVMRMIVFDNNFQSPEWRAREWPARWQSESADAWQESSDGKSFELAADAAQDDWSVLAYRHFGRDWNDTHGPTTPPREQLITDFYSYNAGKANGFFQNDQPEPHWVGDLSMDVRLEIQELKGKVRLQLVEAGERFISEFDLDSGSCRLIRQRPDSSDGEVLATAKDVIRRTGSYSVNFTNFDDRLTVSVDGRLIFGDGHDYDGAKLNESQRPTAADLRPASVAALGSRVRVSDLVLFRDIYYTQGTPSGSRNEYFGLNDNWEETLSNPALWGPIESAGVSRFDALGPDHFMMCGDNSPRSKDGRLWDSGAEQWVHEIARSRGAISNADFDQVRAEIAAKPGGDVALAGRHVVHRQLLIGRAFYVYWPHAVPFGPEWLQFDTPRLGPLGSFRLPFYPNVARMKMIE
jgi:signal peptidase I